MIRTIASFIFSLFVLAGKENAISSRVDNVDDKSPDNIPPSNQPSDSVNLDSRFSFQDRYPVLVQTARETNDRDLNSSKLLVSNSFQVDGAPDQHKSSHQREVKNDIQIDSVSVHPRIRYPVKNMAEEYLESLKYKKMRQNDKVEQAVEKDKPFQRFFEEDVDSSLDSDNDNENDSITGNKNLLRFNNPFFKPDEMLDEGSSLSSIDSFEDTDRHPKVMTIEEVEKIAKKVKEDEEKERHLESKLLELFADSSARNQPIQSNYGNELNTVLLDSSFSSDSDEEVLNSRGEQMISSNHQQNRNRVESLYQFVEKPDKNGFISVPIDPGFSMRGGQRSLKILYDETFLAKTLKSLKKFSYLDKIKSLVKRMDIYIDNFLKTTEMNLPKITVNEKYKDCERSNSLNYFNVKQKYFKQSYTVEGDVLIYLYAMDDNKITTIAAAKVCSYHPETSSPAIAIMRFNIPLLFSKEKSSEMAQTMLLDTLVHELLHIFGFNPDNSKRFKEMISKKENSFPNLAKLNLSKTNIFDKKQSHWNRGILTNEIMTPFSGQDKVLSVFSMEYLELISSSIRTRKDHLSNNQLLDRISNFDRYLKYTCRDEDEVAEYSNFCTKKQMMKKQYTCDDYFIHILYCSDKKNSNGCYEKKANNKLTCIDESNAAEERPYESFGDDSRCFMVSGFARCLNTSIRGGRVFIRGSFGERECFTSGQKIIIKYEERARSGIYERREVVCPDLKKFTQAFDKTRCMKGCYGNGTCNNGTCHCLQGFDPKTHCKETLNQHKVTTFVTIPYSIK